MGTANDYYPYQNTLYSLCLKLYKYLWDNRDRFRRNVCVDDGLYKVSVKNLGWMFGLDSYNYKHWATLLGRALQHLEDLGLIEIVEKRVRSRAHSRVIYIFRFRAGGDNPKIEDLK